jgi:adenylate cyclase
MPDKPSIAVLPFQNMSNDKNQDYFADGIAEDVITDLSKISELFVIARNTSFQYRGGALDLSEVGRKLGIQYILEGSVRRSGDQVRITAQLIDSTTGGHVWAERYDGSLADVFSVQDKVTSQIISAMKLKLTPTERQAVKLHGTNKPAAFDAYLRGLRLLSARERLDADGNRAAQSAFEEAIRIDPEYALAYAGLGWAKMLYHETIYISDGKSRVEALELARKSIALRDNALAHRILAREYFSFLNYWTFSTRKMDHAVIELEAAAQLQPNDPDVLTDLSLALCFVGRPDEALELVQKAMERNPNHPGWYFAASGIAFLLTEKPNLAVRDLKKWSDSETSWNVPYVFLASALALSGDEVQANSKLAKFELLNIMVSPSEVKTTGPFNIRMMPYAVKKRWPMAPEHEEIFLKGLRLAGMKDAPG